MKLNNTEISIINDALRHFQGFSIKSSTNTDNDGHYTDEAKTELFEIADKIHLNLMMQADKDGI